MTNARSPYNSTLTVRKGALTDRQYGVLDSLSGVRDGRFLAPIDFGGRDWSHHSATARALAKRGLVETKKSHSLACWCGEKYEGRLITRCSCKGSIRYRITRSGRTALRRCRA